MKAKSPPYRAILLFVFFLYVNICKADLIHPISPNDTTNYKREVALKLIYKVSVKGHIDEIRLIMPVPADILHRQTVKDLSFSIEPDSIFSFNSNTYALYKLYDLDKSFKITVTGKMTIYKYISTSKENVHVQVN